ncbi:hypothetical protein SteCoe_36702 [Stentor coeruleus]|uniref:START domain-containing protein n=1 Tax=Stentor coeruleus TaxID=5963 RepID=A0A1R2APS4_9CILI|nr:hypothetical protein SteCoe_36702 [Stentor coeruleus]
MEDPHFGIANSAIDSVVDNVLQFMASNDGWEEMGTKEGVTGHKHPHESGFQIVKITVQIPRSASDVLAYIWDFNNKRIYDETLKEIREIKSFSPQLRIMYEQGNAPWPVSNRDFVYAQRMHERDDGFLLCSKSIDAGVPPNKGVERGEILYSGMYLRRAGDAATNLTFAACVDPKGSIPKAVVNKMGKKQIDKFLAIKKALVR